MIDPTNRTGFYPDILHGSRGAWTVQVEEPINARVDLGNKAAYVPEALTEIDVHIQNHEYAHVKCDSVESHKACDNTDVGRFTYFLNEVRVNQWLRANNLQYMKALDGFDWSKMPRPTDRVGCALQWLQVATYVVYRDPTDRPADLSMFLGHMQDGLDASKPDVKMLLGALNALAAKQTIRTRDEWAKILAIHFAPPMPPKKPQQQKPEYEKERKEEKERREKEANKKEEREKEAGKLKGGATRLGCMEIHRHMTRSKPGRRIAMPFGSSDNGMIPTRFERKSIDGKMWKRKKPSGAIIIDCSGSMSWDYNALRELIKSLPNLIVGTYQGFKGSSGIIGRLCVLAENGRWTEPVKEPGSTGGNEVDYEALEWASKVTDGPIVWLSDGGVCGGVRPSNVTVGMIDKLMKSRGIVRILDQKDAALYLRKRPVNVYLNVSGSRTNKGKMK